MLGFSISGEPASPVGRGKNISQFWTGKGFAPMNANGAGRSPGDRTVKERSSLRKVAERGYLHLYVMLGPTGHVQIRAKHSPPLQCGSGDVWGVFL